MYLLVNTAHTYEHESTVAVTKARVCNAGAVVLLRYRCCCYSVYRGCAVVFEIPRKCGINVVLPPEQQPINCTSRYDVLVPIS